MTEDFGGRLRDWRGKRRLSQLQLALEADVSARHIAFLETGRSRPSRAMVMRLGEVLGVPRADRNLLLDAAGFRPAYSARPLDSAAMAPVRAAIAHIIAGHDPYPAFVFDRHWSIVEVNRCGGVLLARFGLQHGDSFLDFLLRPGQGEAIVDNWGEVAAHLASRLRLESAHLGGDAVLDAGATVMEAHAEGATETNHSDMPPVVPVRYRMGDAVYPTFTTITQFGTAEDIALADLRIEMMFPADAAAEAMFRSLVSG